MKKTVANIMAVALWSIAASATAPEFPSYTQRVTATFANEVEAANAEVSIAPLPGGARYAFFCRWDDNREANLRKASMMDAVGVKGTFFLFGGDKYLRTTGHRLIASGHAIGNHSLTHPSNMHELPACEVFRQIALGKIALETNTDWTVNSFAMPWTRWREDSMPERHALFLRILADTGHLWNDCHDAATFSANDREPDSARFHNGFAKASARAEASGGHLAAVFGIHADSDETGDAIQGQCIAECVPTGGVWRTHANAFAAYRYEAGHGCVTVVERRGRRVSFVVKRFAPAQLGYANSLELVFTHPPVSVECPTAETSLAGDGRWSLAHDNGQSVPATIRSVPPESLGFEVDEAAGEARIAPFPPSWHNVFAVVMAPPPWANGRTVVTGDRVSLGSPATDLNKVSGEVRTYILSVDYIEDGVARRVYSIICKSDTVRE